MKIDTLTHLMCDFGNSVMNKAEIGVTSLKLYRQQILCWKGKGKNYEKDFAAGAFSPNNAGWVHLIYGMLSCNKSSYGLNLILGKDTISLFLGKKGILMKTSHCLAWDFSGTEACRNKRFSPTESLVSPFKQAIVCVQSYNIEYTVALQKSSTMI